MTTSPVPAQRAALYARATEIEQALLATLVVLDAWVDTDAVAHVRLERGGVTDEHDARRRVSEWNTIYEWVYGELTTQPDDADRPNPAEPAPPPDQTRLGENFVGWHSSFTGRPIPLEQMQEWRDATVARLRDFAPERVLEIGVGTGLLLGQLARHVDEYVALDFAAPVIRTLSEQVAADPSLAAKVTLRVREADDLRELPAKHFDTVVLNSIVQYFPDGDYLARVLRGVLDVLAPGGRVFVGDVRDLRLLRALRTAILATTDSTDEPADVTICAAVEAEQELLVHPDFFSALVAATPGYAFADVRAKRARHHNELSGHRYDVTLVSSEHPPAPLETTRRLRWGTDVADLAALDRVLAEDPTSGLRLCGLPNIRVTAHLAAAGAVDAGGDLGAAAAALGTPPAPGTPELSEVAGVAARAGFEAIAVFAEHGPGLLDVVLAPWPADGVSPLVAHRPNGPVDRGPASYANRPSSSGGPAMSDAAGTRAAELVDTLPPHLRPRVLVIEP